MAVTETIKKGVIKKKTNANNVVILYPKTTIDQVENLQSTLNNKSNKIEIVDLTSLSS